MGWFKIINVATGKTVYDSRVGEMSERRQAYIAQLEALKDTCEPDVKEKMDKIIDAATRREYQEQLVANINSIIENRNVMRRRGQ